MAEAGEHQKGAGVSVSPSKGEWLPQGVRLLVGIVLIIIDANHADTAQESFVAHQLSHQHSD